MKRVEKKDQQYLSRSECTKGPLDYSELSSVFVEKRAAGCPRVFKALEAG